MSAKTERARTAPNEHGELRLTPEEVLQIERALDTDAQVSPELTALIRSVRVAHQSPD